MGLRLTELITELMLDCSFTDRVGRTARACDKLRWGFLDFGLTKWVHRWSKSSRRLSFGIEFGKEQNGAAAAGEWSRYPYQLSVHT